MGIKFWPQGGIFNICGVGRGGISVSGGDVVPFTGNQIVLFGDSIIAADAANPNDRGIFGWFNAMLDHKFNVIYNAGVAGNSTTQMLARIQADVIDKSAQWCVVLGGDNDLAADVATATIISNLQTIYNTLHAASINVIAVTVPPTTSLSTESRGTAWTAVNQAIRDYGTSHSWLHVADAGPVYHDTSQPTLALPLANYTSDGVHPTALGASAMGVKMHTDLSAVAAIVATPNYTTLATTNDDPLDFYFSDRNPLMTGTTGAKVAPATGTVATGWVVQSGGTWSKVARTDGLPGVWQQVAADGSNVNNVLFMYDLHDDWSGFAPGDVFEGILEFESDDDWVGAQGFSLNLIALLNSTTLSAQYALGHSTGGGSGTAIVNPRSGVLRTVPLTLPATTNRLRIQMIWIASGGTLRISRFQLHKVI